VTQYDFADCNVYMYFHKFMAHPDKIMLNL